MGGFGGPAGPMGPMGGPNRRRNPLDPILFNFQHRWETDRQFRAAFSAISAVITVVLLCACVGVASTLATSAIASATSGSGNSSGGSLDTGTGKLSGNQAIPTNTVASWPAPNAPLASPNPNSQTPPPSPTLAPTATSGGGPGPVPTVTTCGGGGNGIGYTLGPSCPLIHSQPGMISIHAPSFAGDSVNILINFNEGSSSCTLAFTPSPATTLNAQGRVSVSFTVPACGAGSQYDIGGKIDIASATTGIDAAPVV